MGWNLSVDVRTTAGGLLKSSGAAVRSVPVSVKERPLAQEDPNQTVAQPPEAVVATDAGGFEETIQKDVDGILTTPPWDKNTMKPQYEFRNGTQVLVSQTVNTPEGTVYVYEKKGEYTNGGAYPYNNPSGDPTPSNILKIVTVTDRHGNVTEYDYGTTQLNFTKYNGTVVENRLESISMPNGHEIDFTYGTSGLSNRIVSATDGTRTVNYGYTNGMLTSVTSPGLHVTTYAYGGPSWTPEEWPSQHTPQYLLTSITDPRGLTTTMAYAVGQTTVFPYESAMYGVICYKVVLPNNIYCYYQIAVDQWPEEDYPPEGIHNASRKYEERIGGPTGTLINYQTFRVTDLENGAWSLEDRDNSTSPESPYNARKVFSYFTQDLLVEEKRIYDRPYQDQSNWRNIWTSPFSLQSVTVSTTYNFMGNPLSKTVEEQNTHNSGFPDPPNRTYYTEYAYHGADKYWQQKAVRTQIGSSSYRYSYTEYFDDQATDGKKGQVYRVYDEKHANFYEDTSITPPSSAASEDYWKYRLKPHPDYVNKYSAQFDYDAEGRPVDVLKLQKIVSGTYIYVQTHTTYGSNGTPWWGAPTTVVEDYGSGKINRTTETLAYDSAGRATEVEDAAGKVFLTDYNDDGQVLSVTRTDTNPDQPIVTYTYGPPRDPGDPQPETDINAGMVTQVVDEIYDVTQTFTYSHSSGGSKGQVIGVDESRTGTSYGVDYTYNAAGDRETATYDMPNGDSRWKYSDYLVVGSGMSPSRVFQTMNRQSWSGSAWVNSAEEFHYQYDSSGRLAYALFAQTPRTGYSDYSVSAGHRARACYLYDPSGRIYSLEHWWDDWGSSSYTSTALLGVDYAYDAYKGLRTSAQFKIQGSNPAQMVNDTAWWPNGAEQYAYDADLDYLTEVDYNDGLSNEYQSWTYDAAGNRASDSTYSGGGTWIYDNLNRMSEGAGATYSNDILGNRTEKGTTLDYVWDEVNRLKTLDNSTGNDWNYTYRADGMRITKNKNSGGAEDTEYRYDGQMPVEEYYSGSVYPRDYLQVIRYGIGARGIDFIERVRTQSGSTQGYPIYDGHGNMVATLAKSTSSPYFSVNDRRAYDAWGTLRRGNTTGEPNPRYCANLGHVQDDESGLVYMRARYYEPWTGRFVSEDDARVGSNWYIYCKNAPYSFFDFSGACEISVLLQNAYKLLMAGPNFGYGTADRRMAILRIQDILRELARIKKIEGITMMTEGEIEMEANAVRGDPFLIGTRLSELHAKWGGVSFAESCYAKLAVRMIDMMLEILRYGPTVW